MSSLVYKISIIYNAVIVLQMRENIESVLHKSTWQIIWYIHLLIVLFKILTKESVGSVFKTLMLLSEMNSLTFCVYISLSITTNVWPFHKK